MVVSGLIRYVHDSRSSHAATALATMVSTTATVRRVGAGERQIPSEELVVGDIVTLSAGDIVPADCKLLESQDLRIAHGGAHWRKHARAQGCCRTARRRRQGHRVDGRGVPGVHGHDGDFGFRVGSRHRHRPQRTVRRTVTRVPMAAAATAGGPDGRRSWAATARRGRRAPRAPPRTTPPRVGFFGRMRTESAHPGHREERTRDETLAPVGDCIRRHDHKRIKRSLGWMSPVQYRQSQGTAT